LYTPGGVRNQPGQIRKKGGGKHGTVGKNTRSNRKGGNTKDVGEGTETVAKIKSRPWKTKNNFHKNGGMKKT